MDVDKTPDEYRREIRDLVVERNAFKNKWRSARQRYEDLQRRWEEYVKLVGIP